MSYFINPDGTIQFVEDRYDSAGNLIVGVNSTKQAIRNKRRKTSPKQYLEEEITFHNEVFNVSRAEHINAFFDYLTTKGIDMSMTEFLIIQDKLSGRRRMWFANAFRKYRYKKLNGNK